MLGSAKASTVLSTAMSNTGNMRTASATQARRGVGMDVGATSTWVDILLLLRTTPGSRTLASNLIRIDGAVGEAGHDGVDDLHAGGAPSGGVVACVQQCPEHQPGPSRRSGRALRGHPVEHLDDDLVAGVQFGSDLR